MKAKGFGRRIMAVTLAFSMIWSNGSFTANAEEMQTQAMEQAVQDAVGSDLSGAAKDASGGDLSGAAQDANGGNLPGAAKDVSGGNLSGAAKDANGGDLSGAAKDASGGDLSGAARDAVGSDEPGAEKAEENVAATKVVIGDIEITELGYENAKIRFDLDIPENWTFVDVNAVKNEADTEDGNKSIVGYVGLESDMETEYYEGTVPTNEGALQIRVTVDDDAKECNRHYVMKDIPVERRDATERVTSITFKTGAVLSAQARIAPWYYVDEFGGNEYRLYLYYKKADDAFDWIELSEDVLSGYASLVCAELESETKYLYYAVVRDSKENVIPLTESAGSEESPLEFTTSAEKTYTRDDFKDKALYDIIRAQFDARGLTGPLTDARLAAETSLTIRGFDTDGVEKPMPITSLADIPEKMPNLKNLTIIGHDISDMAPLLEMAYLEDVDLGWNDIGELPDLSGCMWRYLDLSYNYITPEELVETKLPATLVDADAVMYGYDCRTNTLTMPDTIYIDDNGKYPLLVRYNGVKGFPGELYRNYKMTVTINDVTKEYPAAMQSDRNLFAIEDAKADFPALRKDTDYQVTVKIGDEYDDNLLTEAVTLRYEEKPVTFEECRVPVGTTTVYAMIYLPEVYEENQIKAVTAEKDGDAVMSVVAGSDDLYVYQMSGMDAAEWLYGDFCDDSAFYDSLSYRYTVIDAGLRAYKAPAAGVYDVTVTFADGILEGNQLAFPAKVTVVEEPIVEYIDATPSGYDRQGDYYYIILRGYYLDEQKIYPVIIDGEGNEYTTLESMTKTEDDGYVYKLKKGARWAEIANSSAEYYYVKLVMTDKVEDWTDEEAKMIPAGYLKSDGLNLEPLVSWYNWKREAYEFRFDSSVKRDTEVTMKLYSDWEQKIPVAEGKGITDAKGGLSVVPRTSEGEIYQPEYYEDSIVELTAGEVKQKFDVMIDLYNRHPAGIVQNEMVAVLPHYYAVGADELRVSVYGPAEAHETSSLTAKLYRKGSSEVLSVVNLMADEKESGADHFSATNWKLAEKLTAGSYVVRIFETVNSAEKVLCEDEFEVIAPGFYQEYQNVTYGWVDQTTALFGMSLPLTITQNCEDASELAGLVEELGLKVEVYDAERKPVTITATPVYTVEGGYLEYKISGLSADDSRYFFRITRNGATGILPDGSGNAFYDEEQYGLWADRDDYFRPVELQRDVAAYTGIKVSDFADDAPYTVSFFNMGDRTEPVYSFKVEKAKITDEKFYRFTQADVKKLDEKAVYRCVIISNRQNVREACGYFAAYTGTDAVNVPVKSVAIVSEKGTALEVGATLQLTAVVAPADATNSRVTWSSSSPAVASVSAAGLVKGIAPGTAVITAVSEDGGKKAEFGVHVISVDDSLYVSFLDSDAYEFTGTKIMPEVEVVYHGNILTEGVDYTVKYSNNVNVSGKSPAKVTVVGKTIPASATAEFKITPKDIGADEIGVGAIRITKNSKAVPVLYYGNYKLSAKDYDYPDAKKNFLEDGEIVLSGKGNFYGSRSIPVTVVADKKAIGKFKVTKFKPNVRTYDGDDKKLFADAEDVEGSEIVVADASDKSKILTPLDESGNNADTADYMIVYPEDCSSAGTVKITIVGLNHYVGTVKKSYKINPVKKTDKDILVGITDNEGGYVTIGKATVYYRAGGVMPKVYAAYNGEELLPGKDYKVSYSGNKKVTDRAKCTVTFLGNYKGSAKVVREFEIVPASLSAEDVDVKVVSADKVFAKAGKYGSAPYVTVNGAALSKKDYDVKYTYTQDGEDVELPVKLEESALKDGVMNVKVTVTGKGNYDQKTSATGYYQIVKLPEKPAANVYDLSKAKVVIRNKTTKKKVSSFAYTGNEIKIGEENEFYVTVKVSGSKTPVELKEGVDFEAVYTNNVNKGKATVVLTGLGSDGTGMDGNKNREVYGGKTVTFSIGKGILGWL